jgi:cobaltochelatase CobN
MHLLATTTGVIDGGAEAVDLGQTPGDIVVVSAADSELAALARAHDRQPGPRLSLRLANLMALGHNLSVDTWIARTARHARLVVVRLLGGRSYWSYGVDELLALARDGGPKVVFLPGGADPDPDLTRLSSVPVAAAERLRGYLAGGGEANALGFLEACAHLLGERAEPPPPLPLAPAGLYFPGEGASDLSHLRAHWRAGRPLALLTFYRALIEGAFTAPVDALVAALGREGLDCLPVWVTSLKDERSAALLRSLLAEAPPAIVLNATGFAVAAGGGEGPFAGLGCPVLQVVFSGSSEDHWRASTQGLGPRDLAMNVVLPELDGRIMTRAVSFKADDERHAGTQCPIVTYRPVADRIQFVARLAANWVRLAATPPAERRIAIVLANYPNRDGRIGNGVGYDTPASTVAILEALAYQGYAVEGLPADGNGLIRLLQEGPTNRAGAADGHAGEAVLSLNQYLSAFSQLPAETQEKVTTRWGAPQRDPFLLDGAFRLPVRLFGHVAVAIQPARGYNIDPKTSYHDPALPPPHGYLAFHVWLREVFGVHAVVHNGKHGNLEWLPGKATALSAACFPEAALGPLPQIYPFIVNDPGEGTQAKRRTSAVIVDHLTPPLTRAETYGALAELESLIDEYYLASGLDRRRLAALRARIFDLTRTSRLDEDAGIAGETDETAALQRLDTWLCEVKEAQIRDGLHILGTSPEGRQELDLLLALTRLERGAGEGGDASLVRALARDLGLGRYDPFLDEPGAPYAGSRPAPLSVISPAPWRSNGDTRERLEGLALALIAGELAPSPAWAATAAVLAEIEARIRPALRACGDAEMTALLAGLDGRFVAPGPSGAPTRDRLDVLPTGRNFYSLDNRAVPTPTAWAIGERSARSLLERHFQDHGAWPRALGLSVWGTANMRTGGDDIAQALAFIGVKPLWERSSWRVTGFEIIPLAALDRPRVDVTLRISGFFRDAFPAQIELFDRAVRAVGGLDEPAEDNPIAARMRAERAELAAAGVPEDEAARLAGFRVFGSKPGAYGAGLQALIDERLWSERGDLARAYVAWGAHAYGATMTGESLPETFTRRLARIEAVVHNQDNREHDLLDSDDYYQFEGGMTAAVEEASGRRPRVYHNDHSRPERPVVRTLEEEVSRVVRSRVVNPKWITGIMRHGYKGAFEIAATLDYMFAFAATTGAVKSHHFDLAYEAFLADEKVRGFIAANNPAALGEIAERLKEALERGLWTPKSNSAYHDLERLSGDAP